MKPILTLLALMVLTLYGTIEHYKSDRPLLEGITVAGCSSDGVGFPKCILEDVK